MAFLRKEHKENYTCISNDVFRSDLSLKARGMLCTMLSLPDDWEFSENGLQAILKDGQTSVRSAIKELEAAGFLSRTRERDESGRMGKCVWIVCDYPRFENPNLVNSNLGNGPQLSTKEQSTYESSTNKKKESTRASYDEIINDYTENEELRSALVEFVKMRKMIKKPLTNKALSLLLTSKKGLDELASTDAEKIDIVNQTIMHSWQGFFPLKDKEKRGTVSRETSSGFDKKIDADYYYQSTGDEELDKVLGLGKYAPKTR